MPHTTDMKLNALNVGDTVVMDDGTWLSVDEVCDLVYEGAKFWGTDQDGKQGRFSRYDIARIEGK